MVLHYNIKAAAKGDYEFLLFIIGMPPPGFSSGDIVGPENPGYFKGNLVAILDEG